MKNLIKTRTILNRHPDTAIFTALDDEGWRRDTTITLDSDVWEDMGRPDTITVTVEPGDLLNISE